jgi:hypothetical protein
MAPRRGERAEEVRGFSSLGKITGLTFQLADCFFVMDLEMLPKQADCANEAFFMNIG